MSGAFYTDAYRLITPDSASDLPRLRRAPINDQIGAAEGQAEELGARMARMEDTLLGLTQSVAALCAHARVSPAVASGQEIKF